MNLLILSRRFEIYSTQRLVQESKALGHSVSVWDPGTMPEHWLAPNHHPDFLLPRLGSFQFHEALKVVTAFETAGVASFNSSNSYRRARNKWNLYNELVRLNLPTPATALLDSATVIEKFPVVLKLQESSQGEGIYLAETAAEVKEIRAKHPDETLIVQEWISESQGTDIRAFVIGDRVVGGMKRTAAPGNFRSNLHQGGQGEECIISREEERLALQVCRELGLQIAGIDFLRSNRGSLVLEANPCPGLEGIETCTKLNIAKMIIQFLEEQL
jgi:ribosomal protein S6--L-glutamate ligase